MSSRLQDTPPGTIPATPVQRAAALIADALMDRADRFCIGDHAEERRADKLNEAIAALRDVMTFPDSVDALAHAARQLEEARDAEPEPGCPICNSGLTEHSVVGRSRATSGEWLRCVGCGLLLPATAEERAAA